MDRLDGKVRALDEQTLHLQHAILGELKIDRRRLQRIKPLPDSLLDGE
jgi:hypothetical protein